MNNDNKLKQALREVVSREFANIPMRDDEIQYEFSTSLPRSATKQIRAGRIGLWRMTNKAARRAAVIAIAFLLAGLIALGIPSVRAAVVGFIARIFDDRIEFSTQNHGDSVIVDRYMLSSIPEGFTELYTDETESEITVVYTNDNGETIRFKQSVAVDYLESVDANLGQMTCITSDGVDIYVYNTEGCVYAIWLENEYAFSLTYYGGRSHTDVLDIIELVDKVVPTAEPMQHPGKTAQPSAYLPATASCAA